MKSKNRRNPWAIGLLTAILGLSMTMPAFAAPADTVATLHSASWSTSLFAAPINNPESSEVDAIQVIPSRSLVYVKASHIEQNDTRSAGQTNNKWVDTFQAYSTKDGKLQWSYTNLGEPGDMGVTQYASDGSVYFCNRYADDHYRLTSINTSGKVNWTIKLPRMANAFPYELHLMQDGSLLVSVAVHTDESGNVQSMLKRYDPKGNLLQQKIVKGYVMAASGNRIVIDSSLYKKNEATLKNAKVDVYGLQLNPLYSHPSLLEFDHYDDQIAILNDGTVLIGTYGTDADNLLFRFDPKGKITSKQAVSDDYRIQSTGADYVLYDHNLFKWYHASSPKPFASVTLKGSAGDANWIQRTFNGNLMINMLDRTYILDQAKHTVISAWHRNADDVTFDYDHHAVYTNQGKGTLSKYVLHP
ncbi:hypothetical protein [Paenibacillus wenxiniae]|uniref:PQQ-like domain-containing protein n=1 Tax=Paenibacillus wenxiniae TaxID=1636843 RepID=A0ABW4RIH5_9BACL